MGLADHPPIANKVVCIDLDGTIIPWGPLMEVYQPFPRAAEAINLLREAGFKVVILTSRLSPTWWMAEAGNGPSSYIAFGWAQRAHVEQLLLAAGIDYDMLTSEKVPAEVYFDDKAIRVGKTYPLSDAIHTFIKEREA